MEHPYHLSLRSLLLLTLKHKGGAFFNGKGSVFGQGGVLNYIDNTAVSSLPARGAHHHTFVGTIRETKKERGKSTICKAWILRSCKSYAGCRSPSLEVVIFRKRRGSR